MVIEELPADVEALRLMVLKLNDELASERTRNERKIAELEVRLDDLIYMNGKLNRLVWGRRSVASLARAGSTRAITGSLACSTRLSKMPSPLRNRSSNLRDSPRGDRVAVAVGRP